MKILMLSLLLVLSQSCSTPEEPYQVKEYFPGMKGCFLLYNIKTQKFDKVIGEENCQERFPACSTFKVPLSVMAFDAGLLKDENQIVKWDGTKQFLEQWNQDHNAKTWMKESVVWFSQYLTPRLGKAKFQKYLKDFNYGNANLSGGITQSWLVSPADSKEGLNISAYEQIEFLKNLWTDNLPASKRAMEITKDITYLETSPRGFKLSGKTGSNFYDKERKVRLGWFISHITDGENEYITAANFSDLKASPEGSKFGGLEAKEITKTILNDLRLW